MDIPKNIVNRFGNADASGDGLTFQAGVITGTVNINRGIWQPPPLKAVYDAAFDAANKQQSPSCLSGTRTKVLEQIQLWIDGDSPKRLYWLCGMAGTGKSTIALTLARLYRCNEEKSISLGASFFFSRGGGDLASANKFAATIASQLIEVSPQLRRIIDDVIKSNPRLDSLGVQEQWYKLVLQPLSELYRVTTTKLRFMIIVDALDECNNDGDVAIIIECLEMLAEGKVADCRIFVTSRPDQIIKDQLGDNEATQRRGIVLHKIERSIVDHDLEQYYRFQISQIKTTLLIEGEILSERTIQSLVERSHGLFIHAATICRFIRNGGQLAIDRLIKLAKLKRYTDPEKELDEVYRTVLQESFIAVTNHLSIKETDKIQQLFKRAVGALVCLSDVMGLESLTSLLGEPEFRIAAILNALRSVIDVPGDHNQPIRILHPSFRDFMLDKNRCVDTSYAIVAHDTHGYLATRCFDILMSQLQRNPLSQHEPGKKVTEIPTEDIDRNIPPLIQYVSAYWMDHFQGGHEMGHNYGPLSAFLKRKYLFWIENLAWIGKLSQGTKIMLELNSIKGYLSPVVGTGNLASDLPSSELIQDATLFLLTHRWIIEKTPLQVYSSALIFSPSESEIKALNEHEIRSRLLNTPYMPQKWGVPSQILHHPNQVCSISLSADSEVIAAACKDMLIHIWDVLTGTETATLEGNTGKYAMVAISPCGDTVASISRGTLSIWNVAGHLGRRMQPRLQLRICDEKIIDWRRVKYGIKMNWRADEACVFSPGGTFLAATPGTDEIFVWEMKPKQKLKYKLKSDAPLNTLHFSPNEKLLVATYKWSRRWFLDGTDSRNFEGSIRAWDVRTGEAVSLKSDLSGYGGVIVSQNKQIFAFSSIGNGKHKMVDHRIETGFQIDKFIFGERLPVNMILRPDDGEILFAFTQSYELVIWSPRTFKKALTLGRPSNSSIKEVVFFPDGKQVASAHENGNIMVWNIDSMTENSRVTKASEKHDFEFRHGKIQRLAYGSSLHRRLRSVYDYFNRPISIARMPQLNGAENSGQNRFLSRDGNWMVTLTTANTGSVWNTRTGTKTFDFYDSMLFTFQSAVEFLPGCNTIVILGHEKIQLWNMDSGTRGDEIKNKNGFAGLKISSSCSGSLLVCFSWKYQNSIYLRCLQAWKISEARVISSFEIPLRPGNIPYTFAFAPDEELYAAWGDTMPDVEIRSLSTGVQLHGRKVDHVRAIEFSPDSRRLVILAGRKPVNTKCYIWNLEDGDLQSIHKGIDHDELPLSLFSFSQDGSLLAISSLHRVYVYNLATSALVSTIETGLPSKIFAISSSKNEIITSLGVFSIIHDKCSVSSGLCFTGSWIQQDAIDTLALPPDYQPFLVAVNGDTISFFDPQNGPFFFNFKKRVKEIRG